LICHAAIGERALVVNERNFFFAAVVGSNEELRKVKLRWGCRRQCHGDLRDQIKKIDVSALKRLGFLATSGINALSCLLMSMQ
jgi:hypothetical protein